MTMYFDTTLITAAALILYIWLSFNVGKARGKYGINAPATTGNENFERIYRVQMNTLEQLIVFLPSLWMFAVNVRDSYAALLGAVWIVGRYMFAMSYYEDPKKRGKGFMISFFTTIILLIGSVIGAFVQG